MFPFTILQYCIVSYRIVLYRILLYCLPLLLFRPILRDEKLVVQFSGLEYMNDDPSEVDVLYAKLHDPSDR